MSPRWTLGLAHELGFAVAMTASFAIVLLGGELPAFAWLLCLGPWVSFVLAQKHITPPALSATLVGLASVALAGVTVARGGLESSVLAGGELLMGLLTARLLVRRTPSHDMQALSLSLLLVLAGSVLNVKLSYIAVFVVYSISAVWALSTRQLLAGADGAGAANDPLVVRARRDVVTPAFFAATAVISVAVLASAVVVFAAFPRVGFGEIGAFLHKDSRLPGSVGLHGDPRLGGGTTVVARARNVPREAFERGLYLRGAVYDTINLDGFSQSATTDERFGTFVELAEPPVRARYELTVMPVVGDTLLTLGGVTAVRTIGGGNANPNVPLGVGGKSALDETKAYGPLVSAMRYDVAGGIAAPAFIPTNTKHAPRPLTGKQRERWLGLPAGFDAKLRGLVDQTIGGATSSVAKADALRAFFLDNFRYSQQPPRFASSPLVTFLLDDRQGHCEYFASAYALLLRGAGVPARVVGGFQGGAWDDGVVVFAEKNAHAWVEWWDDENGWIVDDATPLATAPREELTGLSSALERARRFWDDTVLDYSLQDQTDAISQARRSFSSVDASGKALVAGILAPLLLAGAVVAFRRRRTQRAARTLVHPLARAILDEIGRATRSDVPAAATVREAVLAAAHDDAFGRALRDALALYEADRFGAHTLSRVDIKRATKALRTARRTR